MSKGSTHIDWVVGMIIFLTATALFLFYVKYYMYESTPFEELMYETLTNLNRNLNEIAGISASMHELINERRVDARYYPIYFELANQSNIAVVDMQKSFLLSYDPSKHAYRALVNPASRLYVVEADMLTPRCNSDVWIDNYGLGNSIMELNYTISSITSIKLNGTEYLSAPLVLSTSAVVARGTDCTKAELAYDRINISTDAFTPRVWFISSQPSNYTFHIRNFATHLYINGNEFLLDTLTQKNEISDLTSLYNGTMGLSFIGSNMNVSVVNKSYEVEITLYNTTKFELLFHGYNYTFAINESLLFDHINAELKPPVMINVLTNKSLYELGMEDYDTQRSKLEIESLGFRVEIDNITLGMKEPLYTSVYARTNPILFMQNDGVIKLIDMVVLLWQ